jgi:hypothetical protein
VYDRTTGILLNGTNVSLAIPSLFDSWTTNGTLQYDNIAISAGEKTLYSSANGYALNVRAFTFTNQEQITLNIYLANLSDPNLGNLIVLIYDQFYNLQIGADVRLQEYNILNNSFQQIDQCLTDSNGECVFKVELGQKFYRVFASKVINDIFSSGYSSQQGTLINLDYTKLELHLGESPNYNPSQTQDLTITPYDTNLSGNTSYLNADFLDTNGNDHTICIEYFYKNGLVLTSLAPTGLDCSTGSSGSVGIGGGYLLNRSYDYMAQIYVLNGNAKTTYYSYIYPKEDSFEQLFGVWARLFIVAFLVASLAVARYMKNVFIFAIGVVVCTFGTMLLFPSYINWQFTTAILLLVGGLLLLASKQSDNDAT